MLKPNSALQMTTSMQILKPQYVTNLGVTTKTYTDGDVISVNFKSYGGTESQTNGVLSVIDTAQITCWFHPDITSDCRLRRLRDNAEYEVLGEPENLEERNQILYFKIRRVKGKA